MNTTKTGIALALTGIFLCGVSGFTFYKSYTKEPIIEYRTKIQKVPSSGGVIYNNPTKDAQGLADRMAELLSWNDTEVAEYSIKKYELDTLCSVTSYYAYVSKNKSDVKSDMVERKG